MGYFLEAVAVAAALADGFRLRDLAFAPAAWQRVEGAFDTFGWVCLLRGGRRAYLRYGVDGEGGAHPRDVAVRTLGPGEELPAVDGPAVEWFEPRDVNQTLALFQAASGDRARRPRRAPAHAPQQHVARYRARVRELREKAETADAASCLSLLRDADLLECLVDLVDGGSAEGSRHPED